MIPRAPRLMTVNTQLWHLRFCARRTFCPMRARLELVECFSVDLLIVHWLSLAFALVLVKHAVPAPRRQGEASLPVLCARSLRRPIGNCGSEREYVRKC